MHKGFWADMTKPIFGLSPMDGVTDAAYRYITDQKGHPDLLVTEFVPVEGIVRGAVSLLNAFIYHPSSTPTVAQIYGSEVAAFYGASLVVAALGFDGIDINMGCPAKKVSRRGAGAGLIQTPDVAKQIVRECQRAARDWADGQTLEKAGLPPKIIRAVHELNRQRAARKETVYDLRDRGHAALSWSDGQNRHIGDPAQYRRHLPVTVKTRTGYDTPIASDWMKHLLEVEPVTIGLHGRTLKQMYTGEANWEEIAKAAAVVKQTETKFMGNGDVSSREDGLRKIEAYGLDGVLIGRATFGNPWIFQVEQHKSSTDSELDPKQIDGMSDNAPIDLPTTEERLETAIQHAEAFERLTPDLNFLSLRKHMAWYCKGFMHASEFRGQLMQVQTVAEVRRLISAQLAEHLSSAV
ncbi:MAG: tRNA dihydrouridine synthase [Patescibacteria group bacterium]